MAEGYMRGGVPDRTMAQMQGAMGFEEGVSRIFTAGQPAGVVTAAMDSARQRGAMAAENIRARYFQAEFKQIQESRIKPLQEELKAAVAQRDAALKMTVMPINRVMNAQETRMAMDATEPPPPPQYQTVPGKMGKDGVQGQEVVEVPGQPLPNPALSGPQMNAMVSEEALAFIDPVSGDPVRVSSARGIDIARQADHEFWGTFGRISTEMMNVYSEYKGNPFADGAMNQMMDQIIKQASMATTGTGDPMEAQKRMDERQKFEMDQAKSRSDLATADVSRGYMNEQRLASEQGRTKTGLGIDLLQAGVEQGGVRARDLAARDPNFRRGFLGEDLASKPQWTPKETMQADAAVDAYNVAEEKRLLRKKNSGVYLMPDEVVPITQNWQSELMAKHPSWKPFFSQELSTVQNRMAGTLKQMPKDQRDAILIRFGASQEEIEYADRGQWNDDELQAAVKGYANSKGAGMLASRFTAMRVLAEQVRVQPELQNQIFNLLDNAYAQQEALARSGAVDEDGNRFEMPDRDKFYADPILSFLRANNPLPLELEETFNYYRDEPESPAEHAAETPADEAREETEAPQPTGPLAREPFSPTNKPTFNELVQMAFTPGGLAQAGSVTQAQVDDARASSERRKRLADVAQQYAFKPEEFFAPGASGTRPITLEGNAGDELTNPYLALPLPVLENMRRTMVEGTAGIELIEEAILAKEPQDYTFSE